MGCSTAWSEACATARPSAATTSPRRPALATLRVLDDEGLVARTERLGELLLDLTRPLVERYEVVREVRGLGLMWAIELGPPSGRAGRSVWEHGRARASRGCSRSW